MGFPREEVRAYVVLLCRSTARVAKERGSRISILLGIPVVKTCGLSSYICRDCSRRIALKLEEALLCHLVAWEEVLELWLFVLHLC